MIIIQLAMHFLQKSSLNTDIQKKICNLPFLGQVFKSFFQYKEKASRCLSLNSLFTLFIYLFLAAPALRCSALALLCCMSNLSLVVVSRGCSLVVCTTRSCCSGCSCGRVQALGTQASAAAACGPTAVAHRLSCPVAHGIIVQGLNSVPCTGRD